MKCDPTQKIVDDLGFLRTPDRLLKFCGTHVWLLKVFKTMTSTYGPYNLGGSATGTLSGVGARGGVAARGGVGALGGISARGGVCVLCDAPVASPPPPCLISQP
jgi:hypothetical protein